MSTATVFEQAKRMLYTEERAAAPLHYLALTNKLTPSQRHFLLQESEFIRLAPEPLKEAKRRLCNGRQRKPGGLLGLRNRNFPRTLQLFADQTGITVFMSHLPPGLSRISTDLLAEERLSLTWKQRRLGTICLQIGSVKASASPSNPQDGNFRPTSWNRIFRPLFLDTNPNNDTQAAASGNDLQYAAADD